MDGAEERDEGGPEAPGDWIGKIRNLRSRGKDRHSIHKDHVAADAEGGSGEGDLDCFGSGRGAGHERGAGKQAGLVQLGYGAVYSAGQAEVVRVDDESAHRVSLSTLRGCIESGRRWRQDCARSLV